MSFDISCLETLTLPSPKVRDLYFNKQVDQNTIGDLTQKLLEINGSDEYLKSVYFLHGLTYHPPPIKIYIDSYGGSVYQCLGLIGLMEKSVTPIHTYVTGVAMSAGFMIAIHGHKRYCYEHSTYMYHQLSSVAWGTMKDMEDNVQEYKRLNQKLQELTVKKTRISLKALEDNYERKQDWYMTADQAKTNGCVDGII